MINKIDLTLGLDGEAGAGLDTVFGGTSFGGMAVGSQFSLSQITPAFIFKCLLVFTIPVGLKVYEDYSLKKMEVKLSQTKEELDKLKVEKETAQKELTSMTKENTEINFQGRIDEFTAKKNLARKIAQSKISAVVFLDYISEVTPNGVWVDSISYKGSRSPVRLKGVAINYNEVVKLVDNLKRHPKITEASLRDVKAIEKNKRSYHKFTVVLRYNKGLGR